jgi:hypothetical protein
MIESLCEKGVLKRLSSRDAALMSQFECAIHALAPTCEHCGVRIIGHGLEKGGRMFCCDHCAKQTGVTELRDGA